MDISPTQDSSHHHKYCIICIYKYISISYLYIYTDTYKYYIFLVGTPRKHLFYLPLLLGGLNISVNGGCSIGKRRILAAPKIHRNKNSHQGFSQGACSNLTVVNENEKTLELMNTLLLDCCSAGIHPTYSKERSSTRISSQQHLFNRNVMKCFPHVHN